MFLGNAYAAKATLVLIAKLVSPIPNPHNSILLYPILTFHSDLIPCQRGSPCSDGVLCTNDGLGSYICHCPVGYTGPACEQEIDECDPNPCYNGSTCIVSKLSTLSLYHFLCIIYPFLHAICMYT